MFRGDVRSDEITSGRQRVHQSADDLPGLVLVGKEVQDADEYQRDRLAEIQHIPDHLIPQDVVGVPQIGMDVGGAPFRRRREQRTRVREHQRVVVHVDDVARRRGPLRDLVHVVGGRQARSDIEELPDTRLGREVPDRAAEETALLTRPDPDGWPLLKHLVRRLAISREVVLPAKVVIVNPGRVRPGGVNLRGEFRHFRLSRLNTESYSPGRTVGACRRFTRRAGAGSRT
jgi:hypothetical protein